MANNKHLTLSDRIIIEKGLNNNSSVNPLPIPWAWINPLSARKLKIILSLKNSLVPVFLPTVHMTASISNVVDSILSVPMPVIKEFPYPVKQKILPAVSVMDVIKNLPASSLKKFMRLKQHRMNTNIL